MPKRKVGAGSALPAPLVFTYAGPLSRPERGPRPRAFYGSES